MYGRLSLTATSPAQSFAEPLTLAEVKEYIGVPTRSPANTDEDDGIEMMITAAREVAEIMQGRDLVRKQWDLVMDSIPDTISLREPLVSVDAFTYRDSDGNTTALVADTEYIVDTPRALVLPPYGESWPSFTAWPSGAVTLRFTSGYAASDAFWADAGARIRIGMKLLISMWWSNRLPFEAGSSKINEYPFAVTACLSFGAVPRAR